MVFVVGFTEAGLLSLAPMPAARLSHRRLLLYSYFINCCGLLLRQCDRLTVHIMNLHLDDRQTCMIML